MSSKKLRYREKKIINKVGYLNGILFICLVSII